MEFVFVKSFKSEGWIFDILLYDTSFAFRHDLKQSHDMAERWAHHEVIISLQRCRIVKSGLAMTYYLPK